MSSLLFLLKKDTAADVVSDIYAAIDSAEALRFQEYASSLTLQNSVRRSLINRVYCHERRCAIAVARSYRGFQGRTLFLKACEDRDAAVQKSFYAYLATIIQKVYRGHFSRRYKSDFAQRKRFLQGIVVKGEQLRTELDAYHKDLIIRQEEAANLEREQQFEKIAYGLHHLVSTACSPGIFQSPCVPPFPLCIFVTLWQVLPAPRQLLLRRAHRAAFEICGQRHSAPDANGEPFFVSQQPRPDGAGLGRRRRRLCIFPRVNDVRSARVNPDAPPAACFCC